MIKKIKALIGEIRMIDIIMYIILLSVVLGLQYYAITLGQKPVNILIIVPEETWT